MTLHRFFVPGDLAPGSRAELDEDRSRQVLSVLRMGPGDEFVVFNGRGVEARASIVEARKRSVTFEVEDVETPLREPDLELSVGLALLRRDRFEVAVQKLTELGVREIVPLTADRCVVSIRDGRDWEKRAARYRRIIVEALEQSERVFDLHLTEPMPVADYVARQETIALVERHDAETLAGVDPASGTGIAIGPEGGWSDREQELLVERARPVSAGNLILRAETAAIVAAGTLIQQSYRRSGE